MSECVCVCVSSPKFNSSIPGFSRSWFRVLGSVTLSPARCVCDEKASLYRARVMCLGLQLPMGMHQHVLLMRCFASPRPPSAPKQL